jgi:phage-related protein (TIGR01555 family)
MVMSKTQRKQLHIRSDVVDKQRETIVTADSYCLPYTMGNISEEVRKVQDDCFTPVRTMLEHTLQSMGQEGIPAFVGYGVLTGLAQNGLIRAGVEMRAREMTGKWGKLVREGEGQSEVGIEKLQELEQELLRFKVREKFARAAAFCGYYGGMLLFIDTGEKDELLATPLTLSKETFSLESLKGFRVVEPFTVTPGYYNSVNPLKSDYYKPSVWYVQGIPVHESRFIYFSENKLPTLLRPAYNFFGLPLAQKVLDAVSHYTGCRESSARLLQKYSLTVFKTDMNDVLSGGWGQELDKRVDYFTQMRDNDGTVTIDKEREDLVVMTTSLAGVTDLVRQSMEYVAAMFNEPVTKMWGLSPAGFNTGDNDLRNHYDNIESLQKDIFGDALTKLLRVLQINKYGEIDDSIRFQFYSLSEDDESMMVSNNKLKAETDTILIDAGIISPEEARQRLIENPDSEYNNLEAYTSLEELSTEDDEQQKEVTIL